MFSRKRAWRCLAALGFVALVGCSSASSGRGAAAGPGPEMAAEPMTAEQLAPGARVLVERGGQWLPGTVVAQVGPDRIRVHYEGYGPEWDEDVGPARLRPAAPSAAGNAATDVHAVGDVVLVDLAGRLMLAQVVEALPDGKLRVQYDGFEPAAFEDILAQRVRKPFAQASAHRVGDAVTVRTQGSSAKARVVAVVAADRWLVRFDEAGAAYDRVVGPEMIGTSAGAAPALGAAPSSEPAAAESAIGVKSEVLVSHRGTWHAATVVGMPAGEVRVRYAAESAGGAAAGGAVEETVAAKRVVPAPGKKKPGVPYAPKEKVYIEWHGMFVEGHVLRKTGAGQYKVRFEGTGPASDEIVVARRLRPRG